MPAAAAPPSAPTTALAAAHVGRIRLRKAPRRRCGESGLVLDTFSDLVKDAHGSFGRQGPHVSNSGGIQIKTSQGSFNISSCGPKPRRKRLRRRVRWITPRLRVLLLVVYAGLEQEGGWVPDIPAMQLTEDVIQGVWRDFTRYISCPLVCIVLVQQRLTPPPQLCSRLAAGIGEAWADCATAPAANSTRHIEASNLGHDEGGWVPNAPVKGSQDIRGNFQRYPMQCLVCHIIEPKPVDDVFKFMFHLSQGHVPKRGRATRPEATTRRHHAAPTHPRIHGASHRTHWVHGAHGPHWATHATGSWISHMVAHGGRAHAPHRSTTHGPPHHATHHATAQWWWAHGTAHRHSTPSHPVADVVAVVFYCCAHVR
mmetsp:Transcript_52175/g.167158  ORF Transcript_52175/g.167158 Transcript_52175/m.167158 type:complete len:369 (-) Transcript_52175:588-1694(-)